MPRKSLIRKRTLSVKTQLRQLLSAAHLSAMKTFKCQHIPLLPYSLFPADDVVDVALDEARDMFIPASSSHHHHIGLFVIQKIRMEENE